MLWTPSDITTSLWLDASDNTTLQLDGSNVYQWNDKSGNNRNALQVSSTLQPLVVSTWTGSKQALSFDGSNDFMTCTNFKSVDTSAAHTYIAVIKSGALAASDFILAQEFAGGAGVSRETALFQSDSGFGFTNQFGFGPRPSGLDYFARGSHNTNNNILIGVATVGNNTLYINGQQADSRSTTLVNNNTYDLNVGKRYADSYFPGLIAEVLVLNYAVPEATRYNLEGYLAHKWEMEASLPLGHPYKDNPPSWEIEDFILDLAAYKQKVDIFNMFLEATSTWVFNNLNLDLDVKAQLIDYFKMLLQAGLENIDDFMMMLAATDGTMFDNFIMMLDAVDGTVFDNFTMILKAVKATPAFRSVTAHRVSSVISEVV